MSSGTRGYKLRQISEVQGGHRGKRRRSSESCDDGQTRKKKHKDSGPSAQEGLGRIRKGQSSSQSPRKKDLTQVNFQNNSTNLGNKDHNVKTKAKSKTAEKKSVNERFKLLKKKFVVNPLCNNANKKDTVISQRPETSSYCLKLNSSNEKLHTTPLKRRYCKEISSDQGKSTSTEVSTPEVSLGSSYYTISEASDDDSSSKILTPKQRLIKIRRSYSSTGSDKTLTPGCSNDEPCFKLPVTSPTAGCGLKVPLNRDNRIKTEVQTEQNNEKHVQVPAGHCDNIVDAQVTPNTFRSNHSNSKRAISSLSQTNPDATTSQKFLTEIESSCNIRNHSTPRNIFNNNNVTHRSIHHSEPVNSETSASKIFPPSRVQSPKKSATDRIKRIKNEGCIYKEMEQRVLHNTGTENLASNQPTKAPLENIFYEHSMVGIADFQGFLQNPDNPGKRQPTETPLEDIFFEHSMVGTADFQGFLQNPDNPGKRQPTETPLEDIFFEHSMVGTADFQGFLQNPDSPNKLHTFDRDSLTQEWMNDNSHGNMRDDNPLMSDSMVVNVDTTILNKSELPDPIEDVSMDWDSVPQPSNADYISHPVPAPAKTEKENLICVVTDTNVFVHFLHRVKEMVNLKLPGPTQAKIYVPWMVLKELDHLKDRCGEPLRTYALNAEKCINNYVGLPDAKILGQTVQEASDQQDIGVCPDDKILSCTLQVQKKYASVIILTNDINLRNKSIINNVIACTPHEIISTLKSLKFCKISRDLVTLWSKIISDCCEQAYGNAFQKMESLPLRTVLECVRRFKKYWAGVFRGILLKQALKPLDILLDFLSKQKGQVLDNTPEFNTFTQLVLDFSIYLQDVSAYRDQVKESIATITKMTKGG